MAWVRLGRRWQNLDHVVSVDVQHEELAVVQPVTGAAFRILGPDVAVLTTALEAGVKRPVGRPRKQRDAGESDDAEIERLQEVDS